jgi:hypothetical protein
LLVGRGKKLPSYASQPFPSKWAITHNGHYVKFSLGKFVKGKGLVSMSVEQQLSTLRRWLTALTVVTVVLAIAVFVLSSTRFEHIRAHRIEVAPPNKPALIVLSTNPLGDPIVLINDQKGRKRFGITLDENGNAVVEWFASDGRTLKRLSVP